MPRDTVLDHVLDTVELKCQRVFDASMHLLQESPPSCGRSQSPLGVIDRHRLARGVSTEMNAENAHGIKTSNILGS